MSELPRRTCSARITALKPLSSLSSFESPELPCLCSAPESCGFAHAAKHPSDNANASCLVVLE